MMLRGRWSGVALRLGLGAAVIGGLLAIVGVFVLGTKLSVPSASGVRKRAAVVATGSLQGAVHLWRVLYCAHDGKLRRAFVALPAWYGPRHDPRLPLVIAARGRDVSALGIARHWGSLPALGPFAVVSPESQGRRLRSYSWGDPGQIDDLARMPRVVREALPWLRLQPRRIYAVGDSMGGQETLL